MYVALSGLAYVCVSLTQGVAPGYFIAPLRGFSDSLSVQITSAKFFRVLANHQ